MSSIKANKIVVWSDRKTVYKALALKPDVLLFDSSEVQKFLDEKLELLEVYDKSGKKIGVASRKATHSLHLIDKVAHVFVFNSKGELFLQKRTMTKDVYPGFYAPSASGHFALNDSPQQAGLRELEEEIGIKAEKVTPIGSFKCFTPIMNEFVYVFMYVTSDEIKINQEEVSEAKFYSLKELKKLDKKLFIPALKKELQLYLKKMLKNLSAP